MHTALASLVAFAAAVALAHPAVARAADEAPRFASFTFDNDFFVGFDRHYTNGVQAAFLVSRKSLPQGLRDAPPFRWSSDPDFVFAIGQRIYTPSNTDLERPDAGDRPYAGWLYTLIDLRVRSDTVVDHLTASLGVVGPAAGGGQGQNNFHHLIGKTPARGWGYQLSPEPTIMIGYERAWRSMFQGRFASGHADLTPRVGASVGNVLTYASAGLVVRYGSALPFDLPATHISLGPPRDGYRGTGDSGWYVWGGLDARAIARNLFIQGAHPDDDTRVALRHYGSDAQAGIAWAWPRGRVSFAVVRRSIEFSGQEKPDRFGQLAVSLAY